jgi:hypothetical protein
MAVQNIVLYAPRLYASSTYATNQDPESMSVILSDSSVLTDTDFKFIADALSVLESAIVTDGVKALAESMSMTEQMLLDSVKILVDACTAQDAPLLLRQIKGLSEFILVKDWVEIKLLRAGIWQTTPAFGFRPSQIHLYGPGVYYAVDYYGANPTVNWLLITLNAATWRRNEATTLGETLYSETLYSQSLYGSVPTVGWTRPNSTARQAWTNENGESHN